VVGCIFFRTGLADSCISLLKAMFFKIYDAVYMLIWKGLNVENDMYTCANLATDWDRLASFVSKPEPRECASD
jgi:hypothetical protein